MGASNAFNLVSMSQWQMTSKLSSVNGTYYRLSLRPLTKLGRSMPSRVRSVHGRVLVIVVAMYEPPRILSFFLSHWWVNLRIMSQSSMSLFFIFYHAMFFSLLFQQAMPKVLVAWSRSSVQGLKGMRVGGRRPITLTLWHGGSGLRTLLGQLLLHSRQVWKAYV